MPLFMDVHKIASGITLDAVAEAHKADLQVQGEFDVNFRRYWVDERNGNVFCLVEAPSAQTAEAVHRKAHGLVADEIYEVVEGA
jgi:hypothetical protein